MKQFSTQYYDSAKTDHPLLDEIFALVAYLVDQSPLSLMLAGVLIFGLAAHFPTRSRLIHWIEDQLVLLQRQRRLDG